MTAEYDFMVIGGGMAGTSIAAHLAEDARVCLLEMEDHPGYHSTGRSAALFSETYGNEAVRALTRASRNFLFAPPPGFAETALVRPRGVLTTARKASDIEALAALMSPEHYELKSVEQAMSLVPILRPEGLVGAVLSLRPADIEVDVLHQAYLRLFRARGGTVRLQGRVVGVDQAPGAWRVSTATGERLSAQTLVNAGGAWADEIAELAGVQPLGLQPLRRTACLIAPPVGVDPSFWPMLKDADEQYYLKPDAGMLLISPCDETLCPPGDAQPDELDIAIAVDRIEAATTLEVKRVTHRWAGLRSFVADRSPVVGYDAGQPGFFWHTALGGYGIQTAPALSRLAADLARRAAPSDDLLACGIDPEGLSPRRFATGKDATT